MSTTPNFLSQFDQQLSTFQNFANEGFPLSGLVNTQAPTTQPVSMISPGGTQAPTTSPSAGILGGLLSKGLPSFSVSRLVAGVLGMLLIGAGFFIFAAGDIASAGEKVAKFLPAAEA